ncbi:MAG: HAMP domain-containing sensor histidine kinase [Cyanobacteria bacterium P01_A01_bin.114]
MTLGPLSIPTDALPVQIEGHSQPLGIKSVLGDLPAFRFDVQATCTLNDLASRFLAFPHLPGVIVRTPERYLGMISRQQFLEQMLLNPSQPLSQLVSPLTLAHPILMLSAQTPILTAAQQALRRSMALQTEPIVVDHGSGYYLLDAAELNIAYWQIRGVETQVRYERLQMQMLQSDKMADLGRLVDGVAHEILDPVSFIWGNLSHVTTYAQQLLDLLQAYELELPQGSAELNQLRADTEVDYICQDLPEAIQSIRSGANRLRQLAVSLQNFCHIDEVYPKPANLHSLLNSILLLLKSRLTTQIEVVRDYDALPPIPCFAGQLGQVFMNILVNVIDVLLTQTVQQSVVQTFGECPNPLPIVTPQITITTQIGSLPSYLPQPASQSRWASIVIKDNGPGLPPEAETEIFTALSAEARILKETSLALSYSIVTAKHGGHFLVRSQRFTQPDRRTEQGTEFEILLPLSLES